MKKLLFISILLFVSLISGCATSYKPEGLGGGYSDMALSKDIYRVSFRGNGYTSSDYVQVSLVRRCAELTLQKGYRYFVTLDSGANVKSYNVQTPATINTTAHGNYTENYNGHNSFGSLNANSYTTVTPGTSYQVNRYTHMSVIKMLKNNKSYPQAYDARAVLSNFNGME